MSGTAFQPNPALGATQDAQGGLDRILDGIQVQVPGASLPLVSMALFDAIEEFCVRSRAWRETVAWSIPIGVGAIDLNPVSTAATAVWVLRVAGLPRFRLAPPAIIVDLGGASSWAALRRGTATVVCKPNKLDAFALPGLLLNQWSEGLRSGALSRLCAMPNKPWTDVKMALYHGTRFHSQYRLAQETARNNGDLPRAGFPYFAQGRQGWGAHGGHGPHGSSQNSFGFVGGPVAYPDPLTIPDDAVPLPDGSSLADAGNVDLP